jgi:pimeloyl-ACP methyl ester carboxylesterase
MKLVDRSVPVADTVSLHVRQHLPDEPPPAAKPDFLLVHGLASNARLWDEVAETLAAAGHRVHAVDLRGHGESDLPPEGHDTATAAADVAAVGNALGLSGAVVAGQSWGGNVVVRLAAEHPALVAALALVDGGWINLRADFATWEQPAAALRPPDVTGLRLDDLRDRMRASHPDWSAAAIEATVANLRPEPDGTVSRRLPIPQHMAIVRSMWDDPPGRWLPAIAVPTLLLPAIPRGDPKRAERARSRVAEAAAALRDPTILEYVDSDHDLHAQHPARLAKDLLDLAARVAPQAEPAQ